jgi:hypothetical protein
LTRMSPSAPARASFSFSDARVSYLYHLISDRPFAKAAVEPAGLRRATAEPPMLNAEGHVCSQTMTLGPYD